jgi:hypothetical protein
MRAGAASVAALLFLYVVSAKPVFGAAGSLSFLAVSGGIHRILRKQRRNP